MESSHLMFFIWQKGIGGEKSSDERVAVVKGSGDKNGSLTKRSLANSPVAKVATPIYMYYSYYGIGIWDWVFVLVLGIRIGDWNW